jgi:hypothetical protein
MAPRTGRGKNKFEMKATAYPFRQLHLSDIDRKFHIAAARRRPVTLSSIVASDLRLQD